MCDFKLGVTIPSEGYEGKLSFTIACQDINFDFLRLLVHKHYFVNIASVLRQDSRYSLHLSKEKNHVDAR
jgi:hypothetical protein